MVTAPLSPEGYRLLADEMMRRKLTKEPNSPTDFGPPKQQQGGSRLWSFAIALIPLIRLG